MSWVLAIAALYAAGWFLLPIQRYKSLTGRNGRNTLFVAEVDPDAPYPWAIMAQEVYESRRKYRNPVALIRRVFTTEGKRDLNLRGAEVEVQAVALWYGIDPGVYRSWEAKTLAAQSYFEGVGSAEIELRMIGFSRYAHEWVRKHGHQIKMLQVDDDYKN